MELHSQVLELLARPRHYGENPIFQITLAEDIVTTLSSCLAYSAPSEGYLAGAHRRRISQRRIGLPQRTRSINHGVGHRMMVPT